jgi:hypothetical protein
MLRSLSKALKWYEKLVHEREVRKCKCSKEVHEHQKTTPSGRENKAS